MTDVNNPSPVAETPNASAPVGSENVTPTASLKDVVKNLTGREYPNDEAAAEGIKNTYQMVGRKIEPTVVEKPIIPEDLVKKIDATQKEIQSIRFFSEQPEYNNDSFKNLVKAVGKTPSEVMADQTLMDLYNAKQAQGAEGPGLKSSSRIAVPPQEANEKLQQAFSDVKLNKTADWVEVLKARGIAI